jgi:lysozyme family protein
MSAFDDAFVFVVGIEQGFTDNPIDSGNWTGGRVGVGTCRGTKYGISAASYPDYDIKNLTLDQAKTIAKRDYWDRYHCDELNAEVALQVFDAAYNGGKPVLWLQQSVGVKADGVVGPATIAAANALDPMKVCMKFDAYRLEYMTALDVWPSFGKGWARRIASNLLKAAS